MINAILFDCFGVLVNDGLQGLVDELSVTDPETAQEVVKTVTLAMDGKIDADASRSMTASLLGLTLDGYKQRIRQAEVRNEALLNYILELRRSYKIGLVSNILPGGLQARFTDEELKKYFDVVIASGEVGVAKPDVRIYQLAAQKLSVETSECIFVDDRQAYLDGAVAAGMQPILYTSFAQAKSDIAQILTNK